MEAQSLSSRVRAVTVFRSGATVTRAASLGTNLASGPVRLAGLPLSLDDSTVSTRIIGAASATMVASDFRVVLDAPGSDPNLPPAQPAEIRELQIRVQQLEAREAYLRDAIGYKIVLGDRPKGAPGETPLESPLQARLGLLSFAERRLETLQAQHLEVSEQLLQAREELAVLEAKDREASTHRQVKLGELRKSVVVNLRGQCAADSEIELQYFVPGAFWAPSYAVRLGSDLRSGQLSMRAMVTQRSGEDWSGVALTLSTADRQQWAELPELKSKRIGRRQASKPKKGWRAPPAGAQDLYRDYDNCFAGMLSEPEPEPIPEPSPMPQAAPSRTVLAAFEEETTEVMAEASLDDSFGGIGGPPGAPPMPMASAPPSYTPELDEVTLVSRGPESDETDVGMSRSRRAPSAKKASKRVSKNELRRSELSATDKGGDHFGASTPPSMDSLLLRYGQLRMAEARSVHRGTLSYRSERALYVEAFEARFEGLTQSIFETLDRQLGLAHEIAAMPNGHQRPWAEEYDYAFEAESLLDVVSDGQFHSVPVVEDTATAKPLHVVVPRESSDVFRTVKLHNPFAAPLLTGPIDVYWNDDFLLTSSVAFTAPQGELELGLGVDQAVKVARNTHYREDTVGLMGGGMELTHKIVIEAVNNGAHAISLEVRERLPVASTDEEDIKIELKNVTPAWVAWQPSTDDPGEVALKGGHRWRLQLDAGQGAELNASYEIKIPSKYELRGGNRREW